ncbi:MAG: hypothetical protein Q8P47_02480 [Candidatus Beckwithbacteria bacterium]|nr:hypothetical protein [Candidatus Beckwithbacteria bacterium]
MDIDLATKTISRMRQTQMAKRLLDKAIIWGGLILALTLIVIASLNLWVSRVNKTLNQRVEVTKKQIVAQSKIETQQLYLSTKLVSFGNLIKTHELHQAVAQTVFSLIPNGTSIKGFKVAETGMINLSGSLPSWQLLNQLLTNLKQPPPGYLEIKGYKIKQINFSGGGGINFNLEVEIKVPPNNL